MLARVLFVLLACVPACRGAKWAKGAKGDSYSAYYDADGDVQNADFYDSYNNEILYPQATTTCRAVTRLKRRNLDITTHEEIIDVKEILNNILQGKKPRYLREWRISIDHPEYSTDKGLKNWQPAVEVQKWSPTVDEQEYLDEISRTIAEQHSSLVYTPKMTYKNDIIAEAIKLLSVTDREIPRRSAIGSWRSTQEVQTWSTTETTEETEDTLMYPLETTTYSNSEMQAEVMKLVQHWNSSSSVNMQESTTTYSNSDMQADVRKLVQHWSASSSQGTSSFNNAAMRADVRQLIQQWSPRGNVQHQSLTRNVQHQGPSMAQGEVYPPETSTYGKNDIIDDVVKVITVRDREVPRRSSIGYWTPIQEVQTWSTTETTEEIEHTWPFTTFETDPPIENYAEIDTDGGTPKMRQGNLRQDDLNTMTTAMTMTTDNMTTTNMMTTTAYTTTTTPRLDIKAILAIISNLTYDYEWNLSEQFNKTIYEFGVPTCGPSISNWTTTPFLAPNITTLFPWDFENSSVVSKCFVCGLETPEIPRNAHCADAFAGDFLPLMPVDAKARGKIAGFRKYCRYMDTQNYIENVDDPRAIYGRFTGGCAVRWTDLTGVFTQRTCRSKFRPLMGKHLASKRMAKLELALVNVENGCIISPMATLLPVSRGISLYARFHTCVCNTNWCNRATLEKSSFNTLVTIVLACWLVHYP